MSLQSVVQQVCDEVGLPRPASVASATDQLPRQMFSLANATLDDLCKLDWPVLQREKQFNTVIGTPQYDLPADYRKLSSHTIYDATTYYQLRGSLSPQEWQRTKQLNLASLSRGKIRIYGSPLKLNILPTPTAIESVVYEYLTSNFAAQAGGTPIPRYAADDDVALVDESLVRMGLKWRIKHAKGLEYSADLLDYTATVKSELAGQLAAPMIEIGSSPLAQSPITEGYVRDTAFGS